MALITKIRKYEIGMEDGIDNIGPYVYSLNGNVYVRAVDHIAYHEDGSKSIIKTSIKSDLQLLSPDQKMLNMDDVEFKIAMFKTKLTSLINSNCMETIYADTPDYILAEYIINSLAAYRRISDCKQKHCTNFEV